MGDRFGHSPCGGEGFFRWGRLGHRGGLKVPAKMSWVANV
jgi:hypothetical protein